MLGGSVMGWGYSNAESVFRAGLYEGCKVGVGKVHYCRPLVERLKTLTASLFKPK